MPHPTFKMAAPPQVSTQGGVWAARPAMVELTVEFWASVREIRRNERGARIKACMFGV
jgi:hypothetical protein